MNKETGGMEGQDSQQEHFNPADGDSMLLCNVVTHPTDFSVITQKTTIESSTVKNLTFLFFTSINTSTQCFLHLPMY
jgi:hypothetical protein